MAGWLLVLPLLLLFSCLHQVQLKKVVPTAKIQDASSTVPPVTTFFLPDPELRHTLEELIEDSEHNSYELGEGFINNKVDNETNTNNGTKTSTENHTENVENAFSINASSSQPQITTTTTEKEELVVVPLTDRPSDSPTSTSGSQPTKEIDYGLISSTEDTTGSPDISPVTDPIPPTESNMDYSSALPESHKTKIGLPVKKMGPPAWVNKIARPIVFPAFLAVSWLFLGLLLACYLAVPKLRENTGSPFMVYIVALMLKATLTFCNLVFKHLHSFNFCFYAAAVSYFKSLAMLFWVNIMVFDIWRKSRSLVKFKPAQPVAMWKYHLYGWGIPISLGLLSLLIEKLVPDEATWIIKPGFDNGYKCWFEDAEAQLLYLNTPVGILHISNVILMVFTYRYVTRITDNAFVDDEQGAPGSTLPRDTAVPAAKRCDFISEFWFQFWILTYTVVQWVLWMVAQILQHFTGLWQLKIIPGFLIALQGLFLFIIFISNSGKRKVLKQQFPETFERINGYWNKMQKSQNKLSISKSDATSADAATEPQPVVGQTNPAFVEEENNVGQHGNIALANINQNQEKFDS